MVLKILLTAVNAIFPIVLLIVLGYLLKRVKLFGEGFLKSGNKFVFKVLLPVLLFINVYDIPGLSDIRWDVVLYCVIAVVALFCLGLVICIVTTKDRKRRGVILQCVFRSNFAIIGIPIAAALGGEQAKAVASVISAFSIPLFNIFAVIALTIFVSGAQSDAEGGEAPPHEKHAKLKEIKKILLDIARNPLILGVLAGLLCLGIRAIEVSACGEAVFTVKDDVNFIYGFLSLVADIASPFALIILGAQFEFSAVRGMFKEIAVGVSCRIIIAPLLCLGVAALLSACTGIISFGTEEYPAMIALFGSPTAVGSAIMAREMGNDGQLATQLVVWTSIGSVITIFVTVCILMGVGLIAV